MGFVCVVLCAWFVSGVAVAGLYVWLQCCASVNFQTILK